MFYVSHEFERNLLLIFDKIKTPSRVPCRGAQDSVNKDYQLSYVWIKNIFTFFLFWFIDWLMYLFTWMGFLHRTWEYVTFTTEARQSTGETGDHPQVAETFPCMTGNPIEKKRNLNFWTEEDTHKKWLYVMPQTCTCSNLHQNYKLWISINKVSKF